jgi:signal transduction histidine kinase/CHASE3 domain sensor protein
MRPPALMRPRWSLISQLLVAFAIFAVVIGVSAGAAYLTAARQAAAIKQLTSHYQALQAADAGLEADFIGAAFAAHNFALTGDLGYLRPLASLQAEFDANLATINRLATPKLRPLVTTQARTGTQWFDLMPGIATAKPRTPAARGIMRTSATLAKQFVAANNVMQRSMHASIVRLTESSHRALSEGLIWSAAALAVAVLLVLAASLSTLYTIGKPLRALTATVRRLTAGDHSARAAVRGAAEVREVAVTVNAQADEAARLRAQEAESNRLRAMAREAGLRIREHLVTGEVLNEARLALELNLDADIAYLRLMEGGKIAEPVGNTPSWLLPSEVIQESISQEVLDGINRLFRAQASHIVQDMMNVDAPLLPPELREHLRGAGIVSQLITPFGTGSNLLGLIVLQRTRPGHPWTAAEVDAVESIAADLGRGLNQARLYEAENRLVDELKTLDRAKSDFFATVSHELRAPLTTIEGYVELLSDGEAGEITPQQRKMLETIDRSSVRLRNLVEDLFTLSRLELETSTVMRPVDLGSVITEVVDAVKPSVAAGHLTLDCDLPAVPLMVEGDAGQLERVLINLLSNAVKFTPDGGHVDVSARTEDGLILVTVNDTGIGIPERDQKELFTRFFRASNATSRRIPGTGLGLAIVRMIVTNHGGEVWLESTDGVGTTVTLRLPRLPDGEDEPPTA